MARPRKSETDRRKRWDVLYVTDAERRALSDAASAADLSVSRLLISSVLDGHHRHRAERRHVIQALVDAERQLDGIARALAVHADPSSAVFLQAQLLGIERDFRKCAMPWSVAISEADPEDEDMAL